MKREIVVLFLVAANGCSLVQSLDGYDAEPPLSGGSGGAAGGGGFGGCSTPTKFCEPLAAPAAAMITVDPARTAELPALLAGASAGDTFLLASGTYAVGSLTLATPSVTLRSESGCRGDVVIDAGWESPEVVTIAASNVTVAHLTLARGAEAIVRVAPGAEDVTGVRLHDVYIVDPGDRAVRIEAGDGLASFADGGAVTCSRVELSAAGRARIQAAGPDCLTGGIDAFATANWVFADNVFEGFWCPAGLAAHALRVAGGSRDTLVERNVFVDCARAVNLGFKECPFANTGSDCGANPEDPPWRTWNDGSCPPPMVGPCCAQAAFGHCGGRVRNNFVYADGDIWSSDTGIDTCIGLEQVLDAEVVHNTVMTGYSALTYSSIEWRWSGTTAHIANNIVDAALRERDGALATVEGNLENASYGLFVGEYTSADLHLQPGPQASADVVDRGVVLGEGVAPEDIDGQPRDATPDIGADELLR